MISEDYIEQPAKYKTYQSVPLACLPNRRAVQPLDVRALPFAIALAFLQQINCFQAKGSPSIILYVPPEVVSSLAKAEHTLIICIVEVASSWISPLDISTSSSSRPSQLIRLSKPRRSLSSCVLTSVYALNLTYPTKDLHSHLKNLPDDYRISAKSIYSLLQEVITKTSLSAPLVQSLG